jgi:hypothetical protein
MRGEDDGAAMKGSAGIQEAPSSIMQLRYVFQALVVVKYRHLKYSSVAKSDQHWYIELRAATGFR